MRGLIVATLLMLAPLAQGASQVWVVGLFPGAAVLNVDGQRKLVREGQTGPGGVEVVKVDKQGALLRVDGVERMYPMTREHSAGFAVPEKRRVSIPKGNGGHYWVTALVNGVNMPFLVDTGATSLAFNEHQASRLGLKFREQNQPIQVSTANGNARGWRVNLDRVKIGEIEVYGLEGVVLEGSSPSEALLGMSFLNRVNWREEQGLLVLESRH